MFEFTLTTANTTISSGKNRYIRESTGIQPPSQEKIHIIISATRSEQLLKIRHHGAERIKTNRNTRRKRANINERNVDAVCACSYSVGFS